MYARIFINGAVTGFALSTIVSPRFVSCLRRSIVKGHKAGFVTGLGAAIADVTYATIAAFGLFGISSILIKYSILFGLICGIYLIYVGYTTFFRKPEVSKRSLCRRDFINIFITTYLVTVSNPLSILKFVAIFAGFGMHPENLISGLLLIFGVFVGAMIWWTGLVFLGILLKKKFDSNKVVVFVNRVSSLLIVFFGISMIFRAIFKIFVKI